MTSASSASMASRIRVALLAGHLGEQVGEVVVLHLVEHVDQPVHVETVDDPQLLGLGQLLEQVGEPLVVHRLGQLATLGQRHRPDEAGHVAGVHVAQAGGLGGHLGPRDTGEQIGHVVEVDQAVARPAAQRRALGQAHLGRLPPGRATVAVGPQGDVADRLVADARVDEVAADEDLAAVRLERLEVDVPAAQPGAVAVQGAEPVGVDEDLAPLAAWRRSRAHAAPIRRTRG